MTAVLFAALFAGCAPPPPPTIEGLAYPVLVLWEQGDPVRHDDATDLRTMSVQRVVNAHSPPYLIDSRLDLYRLEQLQSVHGGLWLMANPSGPTAVSFTLARVARADAAQARRLIAERTWAIKGGSDEPMAARLAQATTLAQMLDAIGR